MEALYIAQSGKTPLGRFWLAGSEKGLVAVECGGTEEEFSALLGRRRKVMVEPCRDKLDEASRQLVEYLEGDRREFTLPVDWDVLRPFQRLVLQATFAIPRGETRTYKEIAIRVGHPRSARAVGRAEATNPLPIIIPCHRVIGSDGRLVGYGLGEGLKTKAWLLKLEGVVFV